MENKSNSKLSTNLINNPCILTNFTIYFKMSHNPNMCQYYLNYNDNNIYTIIGKQDYSKCKEYFYILLNNQNPCYLKKSKECDILNILSKLSFSNKMKVLININNNIRFLAV